MWTTIALSFSLLACGGETSRAIPDAKASDASADAASIAPDAGCATPVDATMTGTLVVDADDYRRVWFNGQLIDDNGNGWTSPNTYSVEINLSPSRPNVIAVEGRNAFNQAGLDRGVAVDLRFGTHVVVTDASWKFSLTSTPGWETADFDTSTWPTAVAIGAMGVAPWGDIFGGSAPASTAQWIWAYDPSTPANEESKPANELGYARLQFAMPCN